MIGNNLGGGQMPNIPAHTVREDLSGMSRKDHAEYQASEKGYVVSVGNAVSDSLVREAELKEMIAAERKVREYLEANHRSKLEKCVNVKISYRDLPGTHPNGYTGAQYAEVLFDDGHSRKNFVSRRREILAAVSGDAGNEAEADEPAQGEAEVEAGEAQAQNA